MAQFTCEICGAEFEQKSLYERHMLTSHPKQVVSAADIEKALKGVEAGKLKRHLVAHCPLTFSEKLFQENYLAKAV
ncbi:MULTISPECIES: C2H2-type zinc finger protein [Halomonadaceae]|uniref:C2H2-type domain-containing protein n=2 Tax=Vreelandella TaxID=3137766 RepID=A0A7Z0RZD3_9GAMM|nr:MULTISPECIES: C2H2-type zinc finger protein [Halomonas]AJY50244.1 hypothetical protein KO116_01759 [Halomonas sp. KO116]NYS79201.1 hypothetical protein [Halomonas glaciei]|tara:strand:+ start:1049 stop:1276 length:228 start_codon:yes stop_codon:yes gene_type:complete